MKTLEDTSIVELWSCNDSDEYLSAESRDEAIEEFLDQMDKEDFDKTETLLCFGYVRMKVTEKDLDADWLIEWALEHLDETYGDPRGEVEQDKDAFRAIAHEFCSEFASIYHPWACDIVHQETVNLKSWRKDTDYDARTGT